jgi:phage shock protein A
VSETPEPPIDAEIVDDAPVLPPTDYTDAGVPNFDYVRDRIENRIATSIGTTELAADPAKSLDDQLAERDRAGRDKLEEIRRSLRGDTSG